MTPNIGHTLPRRSKRDIEEGEEQVEPTAIPALDIMNTEVEEERSPTTSLSPSQDPRKIGPENRRSSADPSAAVLLPGLFRDKDKNDWGLRPNNTSSSHHRNRSPYSRSHLRSRSSGAALLSAPLMTRAHSMPNPHTPRPFEQNSNTTSSLSPSNSASPMRARSPFKPQEEGFHPPRSPSWYESPTPGGLGMGIEAIQEDSELDITPRGQSGHISQPSPLSSHSNSFSRSSTSRRRPASPLHSLASSQSQSQPSFPASVIDSNAPVNMNPPATAPASSGSNSPALGPQKYNESYPSLHHYASSSSFSSIPSTPTSARSRSPSISSLETIEDAPEEESEAVEEERILRLKLAAEREERGEASDGEESAPKRRNGSLDVPRGFGFSRGGAGRERKRWSICGGERRADLDLETIWED